MNTDKIGKFIADLRKEKNMTQKELAEKLHITDSAISKWERGVGCPDISLIADLSKVLDVGINEILAGERIKKMTKEKSDKIFKDSIQYFQKKYLQNKIKLALFVMSVVIFIVFILGFIDCYRASHEKNPIFTYRKDSIKLFDLEGRARDIGFVYNGVGYRVIKCKPLDDVPIYIFHIGHSSSINSCSIYNK